MKGDSLSDQQRRDFPKFPGRWWLLARYFFQESAVTSPQDVRVHNSRAAWRSEMKIERKIQRKPDWASFQRVLEFERGADVCSCGASFLQLFPDWEREVGRSAQRAEVSAVVWLLRGGWWIHRNVAEGETDFLPTGAQQNRVGGPGAIPEPLPSWLRRLRFRVVSSCCRDHSARLHNSPNGSPAPTEALKSLLSRGVYQPAVCGT